MDPGGPGLSVSLKALLVVPDWSERREAAAPGRPVQSLLSLRFITVKMLSRWGECDKLL